MTHRVPLSRRQFLARCGALGAAVVAAQLPGASLVRAATPRTDEVGRALQVLAHDTISGLVAFVVPGPDPYSQAQGVTHHLPGGIAARATPGMMDTLDRFLPLPDSFVQAMAAAFASGMSDVPIRELDPVLRAGERHAATVDRALQAFTANDETIPASLLVALMLNFLATSVDPSAVSGPFPSAPFSNLQYAQKAEVFRRMEEDNAEVVALVDRNAPEPMRSTFSGQMEFLAWALPGFAGLFSYSEWGVFDADRRVATQRPVGWEITRYALGRKTPADGWDEFKGYYGGHRRAIGRPARRRDERRRRRHA